MTTTVVDAPTDNNEVPREAAGQSASWSGVFAMSVCAFALIASEFLPVSLLTPIANDLRITEGMAGQGIAISGAFAVFTSLFISELAGNLDRKTLLLSLTAAMGVSGAIVALAPNYFTYMLGRAVIGVVVGGFWSMSAATAIRLVPARDVPRALAIVNGGNALATVVAAPLGAYLGTVIGWRGAVGDLRRAHRHERAQVRDSCVSDWINPERIDYRAETLRSWPPRRWRVRTPARRP